MCIAEIDDFIKSVRASKIMIPDKCFNRVFHNPADVVPVNGAVFSDTEVYEIPLNDLAQYKLDEKTAKAARESVENSSGDVTGQGEWRGDCFYENDGSISTCKDWSIIKI